MLTKAIALLQHDTAAASCWQRSRANTFEGSSNRQHLLQSIKVNKGVVSPSSGAESVNALAHGADDVHRNPREQLKNLIKKEKKHHQPAPAVFAE